MPEIRRTPREWQVTSAAQLRDLRADLRALLRSNPRDGKDALDECVLMTANELATNGLCHGLAPVTARVSAT